MKRFETIGGTRAVLRCGVAACALFATGTALAQTTDPARPADANGATAETPGRPAIGAIPPSTPAPGPITNSPATGASDGEIVVTGTLLRNVVPAGAQAIALTPATIQSTGAISTDQLLATVPQLSSFGNLQTVNAGGTQLTVNRINLRNLPQGAGGGSPTLVLLDGHRLVSAGVRQAYPDPDVIPPALIQRVDVLTDGGSASYGSDAIGGVVNFITRRDFNGIQPSIRQGFANSYRSTDANLTVGKTWTTGGAYVGYNFSHHDALFGRDRGYIKNINYTTGLPNDRSCDPANVVQNGTLYAVNGGNSLVAGNANLCDLSKAKNYYPRETRQSVMAGVHQSLTDSLEIEVKGFYSSRRNTANGPLGQPSATVTSTNPNYVPTSPGSTASQTVYFSLAPVGGQETVKTRLWSYGITPTVTWRFGHDWQARAYYNYGRSKTTANDPAFNSLALNAAIAAGTINPYNIARSSSAAIAQVLDFTTFGIGRDTLNNAKFVVDGPLFALPGGDLRVAFGGEYIREKFRGFVANDTYENVALKTLNAASRDVKAGFAELNIPLISRDNHIPLVSSLVVAAAVRYDRYSDFGSNWAPNVGVTWKPIDWVALRGRWNKSFQAPSLVQLANARSPTATVFPGVFVNFVPLLLNPAVPSNGGPIVAVQGTVSPLDPQRARDYDLGVDISPPILSGLNLHLTYFNINYSGQVSTPPLGSGPFYQVPTFSSLYVMKPTIAQIQSLLAGAGVSATDIANAVANVNAQGGNAYVVADIRARNLGISKVNGFDFGFDYHHDTGFGGIDASYSGSYTKLAINAADGVNFLPNQAGVDMTRFNSIGRIGAHYGDDIRATLTWNHLAGFRLSVPAQLDQRHVGAFDTFDLYLQHDIKHDGLPPITLSLTITNLLNTRPPLYRSVASGTIGGYWNGSTIGRLFQLGAGVKF